MADINYDDIAEKIRKGVRPDTAYAPASSSGETDYGSIADKIRKGVTVTGGNSVPGMERLGGTPPPIPKPMLPSPVDGELNYLTEVGESAPNFTRAPYRGVRYVVGDSMTPDEIEAKYMTRKGIPGDDWGPIGGAVLAGAGIKAGITGKSIYGEPYSRVQAARDVIAGTGSMMEAALPEAIAARPLRSAISLASAMGAHRAVTATGDYLGMPPQYSGLAADVASIGVGAATHPSTYKAAGTAVETAANAMNNSTPTQKLAQGLRPSTRQVDFNQHADRAIPDINTSSRQTRVPVKDVDSLLANIKHAKQRVWGEYAQQMGDAGEPQVDLSPMADAASNAVRRTPLMSDNPDTANNLIKSFNQYRTKVPLSRLEDELQRLNARTAMIEGQHRDVQQDILRKDPNSAGTYAAADAARDLLYNEIDNGSGSPGSRDLKQRYGALSEMERTAMRRQIVAERQAPLNLAEQLARVRAVSKGVSGTVKLATGDLIGGGRDVLSAISDPITAKYVKDWISTNGLVERAFKNNSSEAPVAPDRPTVFEPNSGVVTRPSASPRLQASPSYDKNTGEPIHSRLSPVTPSPFDMPPQSFDASGKPIIRTEGVNNDFTYQPPDPLGLRKPTPINGMPPELTPFDKPNPLGRPAGPLDIDPNSGIKYSGPPVPRHLYNNPQTPSEGLGLTQGKVPANMGGSLPTSQEVHLSDANRLDMPLEIKLNEPPRVNRQGQAIGDKGRLGPANPAAKSSGQVFKENPPSRFESYDKLWDQLDEIDRDKLRRPWKYGGHYERGGIVAGNRYNSGLRG